MAFEFGAVGFIWTGSFYSINAARTSLNESYEAVMFFSYLNNFLYSSRVWYSERGCSMLNDKRY